jgi:hypothetical protein
LFSLSLVKISSSEEDEKMGLHFLRNNTLIPTRRIKIEKAKATISTGHPITLAFKNKKSYQRTGSFRLNVFIFFIHQKKNSPCSGAK